MKNENGKTYHLINGDLSKELSHGICVSNLAYKIGKKLLLDEEMCYNLAVMGLLHDVGKQEMVKNVFRRGEDQILRVEEMRYIRTHPVLGYAILLEQGYPQELTKWVLYHHENYDGTGYPANIAGEEIPLGARILRVCDVFAALTTVRPYRAAYSVEKAMEQMMSEVKNFDMKVFLALMDVVNETEEEELLDHQDLKLDLSEMNRIKDNEEECYEFEEETGNRNERYLSKRDGDQKLCHGTDS